MASEDGRDCNRLSSIPTQLEISAWEMSIFQIKSSGANVDNNPTLTFTLRSKNGLEIDFIQDHHGGAQYIPMLPLSEATGKWIQVGMYNPLDLFSPGWEELLVTDHHVD